MKSHSDSETVLAIGDAAISDNDALRAEIERLQKERDQLLSEARKMECQLSAAVAQRDGFKEYIDSGVCEGEAVSEAVRAVEKERDEAIRLLRRAMERWSLFAVSDAEIESHRECSRFLVAHPEPTP
jgi:hypothetical protein